MDASRKPASDHTRRATEVVRSRLPLDDDADIAQVSALFDALGKGIRTGWFELPSPLAALGGAQ